ncbi:MAG: hypothetical protein P8M53_06565 [Pirellulales bacterium]|nr:hypothetical protein [Pirellulales bacterium]
MSRFSQWIRRLQNAGKRKSYGLDELDWKLEKHLDFNHGFFIEAGANNGIKQRIRCISKNIDNGADC